MNSPMPVCPTCKSIRLEDIGIFVRPNVMVSTGESRENAKNSDKNIRRIADQYGLTDMNNKGGQAIKRAAPAPASGPTVKVGGIDVPVSTAAGAGCINLPNMAQKLPVSGAARAPQQSAMMKGMTRVVGEHKGAA